MKRRRFLGALAGSAAFPLVGADLLAAAKVKYRPDRTSWPFVGLQPVIVYEERVYDDGHRCIIAVALYDAQGRALVHQMFKPWERCVVPAGGKVELTANLLPDKTTGLLDLHRVGPPPVLLWRCHFQLWPPDLA